jgi:hypothetical protein
MPVDVTFVAQRCRSSELLARKEGVWRRSWSERLGRGLAGGGNGRLPGDEISFAWGDRAAAGAAGFFH